MKSPKFLASRAAFFSIFTLSVLLTYLVNREKILTNLKQTDFFNRIFGKTPSFIKKYEIKNAKPSKEIPENSQEIIVMEEEEVTNIGTQSGNTEEGAHFSLSPSKEIASILESLSKENEEETVSLRDITLYFVKIDSSGNVNRYSVKRKIPVSSSPLTDSIKELLRGPSEEDARNGAVSLIPKGTRLLGAAVKNKVASLNFSEEILYNPVGVEGNLATLMQIVYTASTFSTVEEVQFLVNGERREYFSGDEQWIGSPLSRSYFP